MAGYCVVTESTDVIVGFWEVVGFSFVAIAVMLLCRFTVPSIFTWLYIVCIVLVSYALSLCKSYVTSSTLIVTARIMPKSRFFQNVRH